MFRYRSQYSASGQASPRLMRNSVAGWQRRIIRRNIPGRTFLRRESRGQGRGRLLYIDGWEERAGSSRIRHFCSFRSFPETRTYGDGVQVHVRDNNVDQALKALKKKMQREGIFREMKLRNYYEKPSEKRAREKAEAIRRARKLARKRMQREGVVAGRR